MAVVASGLLALAVWSPLPVAAQDSEAPALFHMPLRWCVLQGTRAARDPNAAVLTRLRRASSILAPQAGITLRSPVTSALGEGAGFPVIRDPRTALGRPGDVLVPTVSTAEYELVITRCAQAWQRLVQANESGDAAGGIAKGPVAVIIGDFVDTSGRPYRSVWGYAMSASTSGDWCAARSPSVRWATGGSLMVVDSSDGSPSPMLDRRLVAHEFGHVVRLGHGNGLDDAGSAPGRIDKWCDDRENDRAAPGSLMTVTLSHERVTPWQQRLPRAVAAVHPASVQDLAPIGFVAEQERWWQVERLANGWHHRVRRFGPRPDSPLTRLPVLWAPGVRGDEGYDEIRDVGKDEDGSSTTASPSATDLVGAGISVDDETGTLAISLRTQGPAGSVGPAEFVTLVDADGDMTTGGLPGSLEAFAKFAADGTEGIDLLVWSEIGDDPPTSRAWRWDENRGTWLELVTSPVTLLAGVVGETDHEDPADEGELEQNTIVVIIDVSVVGMTDHPRLRVLLRTSMEDGSYRIDALPEETGSSSMLKLSLETPAYPVCAVNREMPLPNRAEPGDAATLEVHGFGTDGPVSVWLGDKDAPVARGFYEEVPGCAWPWITQVTIPADTIEDMQMVQVSMDGTGMAAECPVLVGSASVPFYDRSD